MPTAHFFQECPTCGRHVRIKAEYLGRRLSCLHCHGEFTAVDHESRFEAAETRPECNPLSLHAALQIASPVITAATR